MIGRRERSRGPKGPAGKASKNHRSARGRDGLYPAVCVNGRRVGAIRAAEPGHALGGAAEIVYAVDFVGQNRDGLTIAGVLNGLPSALYSGEPSQEIFVTRIVERLHGLRCCSRGD